MNGGCSTRRIRQHVNPLSNRFKETIKVPDWTDVYENPARPIHLDIGCARGNYLLDLASQEALPYNILGVEIRRPLVEQAKKRARERDLNNISFLFANMNVHMDVIFGSLPGPLASISILHPDPWYKKKHARRRLVTESFALQLSTFITPEIPIYVQTDVKDLDLDIRSVMETTGLYKSFHLATSPLNQSTDREIAVLANGGNLYRTIFRKKNKQ